MSPPEEFRECSFRVDIERLAYFDKFHDIETPLAPFDLGDEGLRVAKSFSQHVLGHPGLKAKVAQQAQKCLILLVVCRARHDLPSLGLARYSPS